MAFVEDRKLQAESGVLKGVMGERKGRSGSEEGVVGSIVEPRFRMFLEHAKINNFQCRMFDLF